MRVKFEGDFEITNLDQVPDDERESCIRGAIYKMVLDMPEEFLEIIDQHDIIIEERKKVRQYPKVTPKEGHFGFYTGR